MKKIMFNDKCGLTQAVLECRKTQTRRMLNSTMFFQRLVTCEGWSNEDVRAWERACNRQLYEAQGYMLEQMLDYALSSSRYKVGEVVAMAQKYKDIALDMPVELAAELIKQPGWKNKMFVKADLMPHHICITNIRVERLQDISEEDCLKEGIWRDDNVGLEGTTYLYHGLANSSFRTAKEAYAALIDKISGKDTWESNPWVFVYDFELVK